MIRTLLFINVLVTAHFLTFCYTTASRLDQDIHKHYGPTSVVTEKGCLLKDLSIKRYTDAVDTVCIWLSVLYIYRGGNSVAVPHLPRICTDGQLDFQYSNNCFSPPERKRQIGASGYLAHTGSVHPLAAKGYQNMSF